MLPTFDMTAIAQASALRVVDCLVEGTLITIFAALLLKLARRQNAGTRFAVWFSALMAIATLPWLAGALRNHGASLAGHAMNWPPITLPGSWALYSFAAWAVIAAFALVRVGRGLWKLHVLRRSFLPVDSDLLDSSLRATLQRHRGGRLVSLYESDHVQVPTALGWLKPAIVLPHWAMQELSPAELNQVLLHELAHLRRWDDWTNLAQKVVKALFFFHPAVWWIEKKVSLEREMACDDAVLAETASPRAYAECLAHLAEKTFVQRSLALAQAALGRIRHTSLRVAQILDANRPKGTANMRKPAVGLVAGFAVLCVVCVSRAPHLVAFQDGALRSSSATNAPLPDAGLPNGVRITPVSMISTSTGDLRTLRTVSQTLPAAVVRPLNKSSKGLSASAHHRSVERPNEAPVIIRASANAEPAAEPRADSMVRLTNLTRTSATATETVFVVIESRTLGAPDQSVYSITVWRLTVQRQATDQSSKIPHKET